MVWILNKDPKTYVKWAMKYYFDKFCNHKLTLDFVEHIYDFKPMKKQIALGLNLRFENFMRLRADLKDVGYNYDGLYFVF